MDAREPANSVVKRVLRAKRLCPSCPLYTECAWQAMQDPGASGIYAGVLYGEKYDDTVKTAQLKLADMIGVGND